jgi:nitroreductase
MSAEQCIEINRTLLPSPQSVEHFLKSRRSIRTYKDELLDRRTLEKLIDIARYAPSGHNVQPVSWIVVSGRDKLKILGDLVVEWMRSTAKENPALDSTMKLSMVADAWSMGVDVIMRGAPHIIVAHAPKLYGPLGHEGCLIALSYLELAAYSLKVGACWAGYFEMALAADQDHKMAWNNLRRAGKTLVAEKAGRLGKPVQAIPGDIEMAKAMNEQGVAKGKAGDLAAAILFFEKAVEFAPGYSESYNNLGYAYYRKGGYGRAEEYFKKAVELDPANKKAAATL